MIKKLTKNHDRLLELLFCDKTTRFTKINPSISSCLRSSLVVYILRSVEILKENTNKIYSLYKQKKLSKKIGKIGQMDVVK